MASDMNSVLSAVERRQAERRSCPATPVEVDWCDEGPFEARSAGITIDRSMDGFSLIIACSEPLKPGQTIRVKPPELPPLPAVVRWHRRLDEQVIRVGCSFITRSG